MATLSGTYGLVKRGVIAFRVTVQSAADTVENSDLFTTSGFAALAGISATNSPLYSFLSTTRASNPMVTAWRALGGKVTARLISGTATDIVVVQWASTPGTSLPRLMFNGGVDQVFEVVISVPHSICQ